MRVLVILDYRGAFWSSTTRTQSLTTVDVPELVRQLRMCGFVPELHRFAEVDLSEPLDGVPFIYTSSEDRGLEYRGFIEDQVLALTLAGAEPIPSFPMLRAHHNKVFMEQMRRIRLPDDPLAARTQVFGTYEEFLQHNRLSVPAFVKTAAGSSSKGVFYCPDIKTLERTVRRISRSSRFDQADEARLSLKYPGYVRSSTHRRRFVVQEQVPGLAGDFKVLRYGNRFFALFRRNRAGDPRASGSGLWDLDWASHCDVELLLAYAAAVSDQVGEPVLSMDIGIAGDQHFLLEFQAVYFGPGGLELAAYHYERLQGRWHRVEGTVSLERAIAEAVAVRMGLAQ